MTDFIHHVALGRIMEILWNWGLGMSLNMEGSVSCSIESWKIRLLRIVQMMKESLVCEVSMALSGFFCKELQSAVVKELAVINKISKPLK